MLSLFRLVRSASEVLLAIPLKILRLLLDAVAFNPRLGPLRYIFVAVAGYAAFAVLLVYVVAPIRGWTGQFTLSNKLEYDAERWLATAIYDAKGDFAGTFDARLDSLRDVNYTGNPIEVGEYTANPDHKSIPVREVPDFYWQCLRYHEDRYLGGPLNPFGIDLLGVLKIPYSTITRSFKLRRPSLGVGGSTLPMQFARVIYKTPPSTSESAVQKLKRKVQEWWLAPVIYFALTRDGNDVRLREWAANHIWLAQRTGGSPLHGVELTSRIVFGKEAKDLSIAEQFVLASAVNKPIILLDGSETLNEVRLDRWQYITEVRARTCAEVLIPDVAKQKEVVFELVALAGGPPDPKVKPRLQKALDEFTPALARRAEANPEIRSNALLPAARYGLREEMKQVFGFAWRDYVRGVTTTLDAVDNLSFRRSIETALAQTQTKWSSKIDPQFTLDPAQVTGDLKSPDVVVVAANAAGEIIRYYEAGETASYFGSPIARNRNSGIYEPASESRMVASTGKMLAAIAIANEGRDNADTLYTDTNAPSRGLETCARGDGRFGRKAVVAFACSLNSPLVNRAAIIGQKRFGDLITKLGFTMPPSAPDGQPTPPSTAAVMGQIAGSPRRVHHTSAIILKALIGRGNQPVKVPSLISTYDYTDRPEGWADSIVKNDDTSIRPHSIVRRGGTALLKTLLEAPLCYQSAGTSHGTLKTMHAWCASARRNVRLHFAKTGTQVTADPDATVDTWATGGIQFSNGAAYSYVVVVGTGSAHQPWARNLHAAQIAAPLMDVLLKNLEIHAKSHPQPDLLPPAPPPQPKPSPGIAGVSNSDAYSPAQQTMRNLIVN